MVGDCAINDSWNAPIKHIRRENPQWWVMEIFDGFGAHTLSPTAMQLRLDSKILSLKEEADSSHVNQGYDKFVAKSDK